MNRRLFYSAWPCLFATLMLLLNGCATIFHGSSEKVNFASEPSGAKVYLNGQLMGNSPLELRLEPKKSYTVEFRKDGFDSKALVLTSSVGGGWVVLDVLFGLVPVVVDAATGNWYSFDNDYIRAPLEPKGTAK